MNTVGDFSTINKKTNTLFDYLMMWLFERVETDQSNKRISFYTWTTQSDDNHFFYKHMLIRIRPFKRSGITIRSDVKLPIQQKNFSI